MPLQDVRVLDLTQVLAGPFGTRLLGDLGAEVIKIEPPGAGDPTRKFPPHFLEGESAYFLCINRNKKSLTLDLRTERGKEIFYQLAEVSDVVIDNFRPGVTQRLGVEYETLKKINPRIICCSISGFGSEGPYRDKPGFDHIVQALSGAMSLTGEPGRPPVVMGLPAADLTGGWAAVQGILAALYYRERTGMGGEIDIGLLDMMVSLLAYVAQFHLIAGDVPSPVGSGHVSNVPIRALKTKDGSYIQISCPVQKFYENLAQALSQTVEGLSDLSSDPRFTTGGDRYRNRRELEALLDEAFLTKTSEEWLNILEEADVPCAPINTVDRTLKDPQVLFRNMVVEVDHPVCGRYKTTGNHIKMSQISEEMFEPPPILGEHADDILRELLGYSQEKIDDLRRQKVI